MKTKVALNWSSGKDASLALQYLLADGEYEVKTLLTSLSAEHKRVSMHGLRAEMLDLQAAACNLPLQKIYIPQEAYMPAYERVMQEALKQLKAQDIHTFAFGDIFLQDLRSYRIEQLKKEHCSAIFPVWGKETRQMVADIEDAGIEAIIVCVDGQHLGKEFLGKKINRPLLDMLPKGVDPCGEKGEYHSFVVNAPFFSHPLKIKTGETVYKTYSPAAAEINSGFYFLDVFPA